MRNDRLELASLMINLQACLSLVAGVSALLFGIVEPGFRFLGPLTIGLAALMFWLAGRMARGSRRARWILVSLEITSLAATLLLALLPIGSLRGPVPLLVNLGLPVCVLALLLVPTNAEAAAAGHQAQQ